MNRAKGWWWIRVLLVGAVPLAFFACGGAADTTPIIQTVVVEKAVEKQVVQTVVVEKAVEKQVVQTVVVEKVVVATAAPSPTATALPPLKRATLVRVARDGQLGANPNATVDPFTRQSSIASCCYERLTNLASDFSPANILATGWSSNPTATEWTFNLRKGVKFHSGKEFTAQDVIYSFKEMFKEENGYPGRNQLGTFVDASKIAAVDSYTVRFTLPSPQAELPGLISIVEMVIVPEGQTVKERQTTVNGTGPFVMEKFDVNAQIWQWKKNANYWDAANRPRTDLIEISGIPDETNRVAAISTGAIDLITATGGAVKVAQVRNLEKNPDVQLLVGDPAISIVFFMWMDTPPFDDIRVRTAMKKIVDRQFIANTVLGGYALPGNDSPIPVTWESAYAKEAAKADLEGAKKLLAEAGYSKDKPLKLTMHVGDIHAGALEMT
ncbi:MAG: hypothetical protein HY735_32340, partial [Verrucomicrobia bacterium]|nr:hypothetical protein [Verrucomicrobiota bacterium]